MGTAEQNSSELQTMRDAVEQAFRGSPLPGSDLGVIVRDDALVLKGFVCSAADSEKAQRIASEAAPGALLRNELAVNPVGAKDAVYEAGVESFPASDPPSWMSN